MTHPKHGTQRYREAYYRTGLGALTASMSADQLKEWHRKRLEAQMNATTLEQRIEWGRKGADVRMKSATPEEIKEWCRKRLSTIMKSTTPEQRSEWCRKAIKARTESATPEKTKQWTQKRNLTLLKSFTPDERSEWGRKGAAAGIQSMTLEQKKVWHRKKVSALLKSTTRTQRSEWGRQGALLTPHRNPTWPEAIFYGLVYGNPVTENGFTAQHSDGHGIYDGAWLSQNIIAELDGGGHHIFKDRHMEDEHKDIMRLLDGNLTVRAPDENELFLKALAMLEAIGQYAPT